VTAPGHDIVFYDGVCGLCNKVINFLLRRDREGRLRFATLQGEAARRLLVPLGGRPDDLDTVYVITADGVLLERSRALIRAASSLGGFWRLAGLLRVFPAPLTDLAYRLVARLRYRIFGRLDACPLPPPALRQRFVAASID
jgi:predicted DCC family thiol-disulfide oxidoreductase YuxK